MANSASEEINLLELLASFLATLKKNLLITVLLPTLGVITGLLVSYSSSDRFESSMLIETSLLSENECRFLLHQLEKTESVPGLTPEEKKSLIDFSFNVYQNPGDELKEKGVFIEIHAIVKNEDTFQPLQQALLNLIEKHPSVPRHRSERAKYYDEMIVKIEEEIRSMETVKKQISANVQATYLNPAELYASSVNLQKEKIQYEIRRDQAKTVHLVKAFETLSTELKPSLLFGGLAGFVIGCALLCVVLFALFLSRYLSVYETTH